MKKEDKIPMKDKLPFIDKPPVLPCQKRVEWIMNGERYTGSDCRFESNGTANRLNKQLLENVFYMADHIDEVDLNFEELEEKLNTVLENIELLADEEFVKLVRTLMIFRKKQIPLNLKFENKLNVHSKKLKEIENEIGYFVVNDENIIDAKSLRMEVELNKEIVGNYSNENYYGEEVENNPSSGLKSTVEVIMQHGIENETAIRGINDILNEQNIIKMNHNIDHLNDIVGKGILKDNEDEEIVEITLTNKILKIEENLNKEVKIVEELNEIIHGEDNDNSFEKQLENVNLELKEIDSKFQPIDEKFIEVNEELEENKNSIEINKNDILILNSIIKPNEDDGLESDMKWAKIQIGIEEGGKYPSDSLWGSHIQLATLGNRNEQSINNIQEEIGSTKTKGIKKDVNDLKIDVEGINGRLKPLEENDLEQNKLIEELTKNNEKLTSDYSDLKEKYDDLLERVIKLEGEGEP